MVRHGTLVGWSHPRRGGASDQAFINQLDLPGPEFVISTDGAAVPALRAIAYNDTGAAPDAVLKITGANALTLYSTQGNDPILNTGGFVPANNQMLDLDVAVSGLGPDFIKRCVEMNGGGDSSRINLLKPWTDVAGLRMSRGLVYLQAGNNTLPTDSLLAFTAGDVHNWFYFNGNSQELAGLIGPYQNKHRIFNNSATEVTLTLNVPAGSAHAFSGRLGFNNSTAPDTDCNISLVKKGAGIQTMNQKRNAYTGTTTIEEGILNIDNEGDHKEAQSFAWTTSLGTGDEGTTVNAGATLNIQGTGGGTGGGVFSEPLTLSGNGFGGMGALRFSGDGTGVGIGITWKGAITLGADTTVETSTNTIQATCSGGLTDDNSGYGLTKNGAGTLNLIPATVSGDCFVNDGALGLGAGSSLGSLLVANGTTLSVANAVTVVNTLTFSGTSAVLNVDYGDVGGVNPVGAAITAGSLANHATVTVNVTGLGFGATGADPIVLLDYGGTRSGSGTFVQGSLPTGVVGSVTDDGSRILLSITGTVNDLVWSGTVDGNWDLSTLNWSSGSAAYQQSGGIGDIVKFLDGPVNRAVTVTTTVTPALMIVNNSSAYSFSGPGKISGITELRKDGSGQLTLSTANDYTNGTVILDGDVLVGNNAALGTGTIFVNQLELPQPIRFINLSSDGASARTLPNSVYIAAAHGTPNVATLGSVWNNGLLTISGPVEFLPGVTHNVTMNSDVTFSGGVVGGGMHKLGSGTWTVTGAPANFTTGFDVRDGTLVFSAVNATNTGAIRADAENATLGYARVVVTNGAVVRTGGNLLLGNDAEGIGRNYFDVSATCLAPNGGIVMNRNRSTYSEFNLLAGGDVTVESVGVSGAFNANHSQRFNFNGGTLRAATSTGSFMQGLTEAVIQDGGAIIDSGGYNIDVNQALTGTGGLTKNGLGQLTLQGTNTFAGNVQVNAGDLTLYSAHAGAGSVTCADGTTLGFNSSGSNEVVYLSAATVGSAVGGKLKCRFGGGQTGNPTSPAAHVSNLTLNGTITVDLPNSDGATTAGVIPLVGYDTFSGTPTFVVGALADLNGADWVVLNSTSARQIQLVPSAVTLTWSASGGLLQLSWPLPGAVVQSNSVSVAEPNSWFALPGSETVTSLSVPVDSEQTHVFYRLLHP
ncbi:MAG TPA: autotransporter-associated beta strand repeat-containing protein [Verrucomicrobiota bacterium]|nr:autotransporter-associated beta strand repeat-containing protein [Verrucomicrobiota bacterium]HNU50756.1 autotransporter-associated beta strand repeat-containing protein [Verrucomicrobiota bacterium]